MNLKRTSVVVAAAIVATGLALGMGCRHVHVRGGLGLTVPVVVAAEEPFVVMEAPPPVVVMQAPPAVIYEPVLPPPSGLYIWIGGYWHWDRNRYVWMKGHYERPPHKEAHWVAPRYERGDKNWKYQPGHWENPRGKNPEPPPRGKNPTPPPRGNNPAPPPRGNNPTPPPRGPGR